VILVDPSIYLQQTAWRRKLFSKYDAGDEWLLAHLQTQPSDTAAMKSLIFLVIIF